MKKRIIFGFIAILLALILEYQSSGRIVLDLKLSQIATVAQSEKEPDGTNTTTVSRIIDGDTIVVTKNGVSEKIRLIGVNTPETVDPRKAVECFGKEASAFTKSLLLNTAVRLESDSSQGDRDKYGRLLRYVFLQDGTFVNLKILTEGYGYEYTYRVPYQYQKEFKTAEQDARESQKGLWASGVCDLKNVK